MGACIDISSFIEGSGVLSQHFIHMLRLYDSKRERKTNKHLTKQKTLRQISPYIYIVQCLSVVHYIHRIKEL